MILDLCQSKFLKESNEEVHASSLSPTIKLSFVFHTFLTEVVGRISLNINRI